MAWTGARISAVAIVGALLGGVPATAYAEPSASPSPPAAEAKKGTPVCTVADKNAIELSGLVDVGGTLYAVNDGTNDAARKKVFKFSGADCKLIGAPLSYPANTGPVDPEDIALGPNGEIWIADIGDNSAARPTICLWKITADKIDGPFRMAYPDGKKYDAEALLIGADGLPIVITKVASGPGLVFTLTAPLDKASTKGVPLKAAGEVKLPKTTTENPLTVAGRNWITGAALSPDRSKVVLRTYADAFEWQVSNNDIVAAITTGKPKITALPNEPWGEAITYTADGKNFLTVSETEKQPETNRKPIVLSYVPNTADPAPPVAPQAQVNKPAEKAWWSSLVSSTDRLYMLIGSIGVVGLILVLIGVLGIKKARKRRREEEEEELEESETRLIRAPGYQQQQQYYDQGYGYPQQQQGYGYPPQQQGYPDQGYYPDQGQGYGQQQQPYYPEQYPPQQYPPQQHPQQGYPDQGYGQQQPYR